MQREMILGSVVLAMLGCAELETEPTQLDDAAVVSSVDLGALLGPNALVTGVAVEPVTGRRLVLDATRNAVVELAPKGAVNTLWTLSDTPGVDVASAFTDMVAIEPGLLALTAIHDGYLLELESRQLRQHFCYEPGFMPGNFAQPEVQMTLAVAYDGAAELLYAQPRSYMDPNDLTDPVESLFSSYDLATGTDLTWTGMPDPSFTAGGMVIERSGVMLMGVGSTLQRYTIDSAELTVVTDLSDFGIEDIAGLAIDHAAHTLLVLDGTSLRLVELRLSAL